MLRNAALSTRNKIGLVIAGLLGLVDCAALVGPPTPSGAPGPPLVILVLDAVLGVVTVVSVIVGWRAGRRGALRLAAGTRVLSAVTALPAFFVDVPPVVKLAVSVAVVLALVAAVLLVTPTPRIVTSRG